MLSMIICSYGPDELIQNTSCTYNHEMCANLPNFLEFLLVLTPLDLPQNINHRMKRHEILYFPTCNDIIKHIKRGNCWD